MKFVKPFKGVKAGEFYPTQFMPGDVCPEELILAASSCGALERIGHEQKPKAKNDRRS